LSKIETCDSIFTPFGYRLKEHPSKTGGLSLSGGADGTSCYLAISEGESETEIRLYKVFY
jgi:hypothetical protein